MPLAELRTIPCGEVSPRLSEYLDEELPSADRMRFYLHLSRCVACRAEADGLASLVRAMHARRGLRTAWRGPR
jgi:predicted anti-sigma-YlaC factor YlaD